MAPAKLVAQIKEIQKTDPQGKEQWIAYVDVNGGGNRDPARHDAAFLKEFIDMYQSGGAMNVHQKKGKTSMGAQKRKNSSDGGLCDQIKEMQRNDPEGRAQWIAYVEENSEGDRDPALHDSGFIQAFLDQYESGERLEGPDVKRRKLASAGDLAGAIKEMQKNDPVGKEQWIAYVDEHGEGNRDPTRHDDKFIRGFFKNYDSGKLSTPLKKQKPWTNTTAMNPMEMNMGMMMKMMQMMQAAQRGGKNW